MTTPETTNTPTLVISYKLRTSQMPAGEYIGNALSPTVLKPRQSILYRDLTYIVISYTYSRKEKIHIVTVKPA